MSGLAWTGFAASAFADAPKVNVTSFVFINNTRPLAELCGRVSGVAGLSLVRITVDANSGNPGVYHASAGKDGLFCSLVASYRGTANVSLELPEPPHSGGVVESGVVTARAASSR